MSFRVQFSFALISAARITNTRILCYIQAVDAQVNGSIKLMIRTYDVKTNSKGLWVNYRYFGRRVDYEETVLLSFDRKDLTHAKTVSKRKEKRAGKRFQPSKSSFIRINMLEYKTANP